MMGNLDEETTVKVLRYLKAQDGNLNRAVEAKLAEACETARLAPLSERHALVNDFGRLIDDNGSFGVRGDSGRECLHHRGEAMAFPEIQEF